MPSADFSTHDDSSALARASDIARLWRPPGVSHISFYSSRQIYPGLSRMTIGLRGSWAAYPDSQALYLVSVRRNKYLSPASFRFALAGDTLAFNYKIPVITALSGLEVLSSHPVEVWHARHTKRYASPRRFTAVNI